MLQDTVFIFLIIIALIAAVIIIVFLYNRKLKKLEVSFVEDHDSMQAQIDEAIRHGKEIQLNTNMYKGEINEILGSFILLDEYEHLAIIGSVSKAASFDLIGLKEDQLDFIEIKSVGTRLSATENKVKKIIEKGNVFYRIVEAGIPSQFVTKDRTTGKKKE